MGYQNSGPPRQCADLQAERNLCTPQVFPRCSLCPLFDAERAIRDVLGENPPPGPVCEITLGPRLRALLRGELPPHLDEGSDPDLEVPDFAPEQWAEPPGKRTAGLNVHATAVEAVRQLPCGPRSRFRAVEAL